MRRNTEVWSLAVLGSVLLSGTLNVIGFVADLFGFTEGVSKHSKAILTFLAANWKWMLLLTVTLLAIFLTIKWRRKKELEKRETLKLSWFHAKRQNTEFIGGGEYLLELRQFLIQKNPGLSWWAVTGVAGIGKTRLVLETLQLDEFRNADVQLLSHFDDYREDSLKKRVDDVLESPNLMNILIAEDAQIYMDNIGALIEYLENKRVEEIGDHKIRLLLLIRMGEDEDLKGRYKQLSSKTSESRLRESRYNSANSELRISKYEESDIKEIVKSYIAITKKKRGEKNFTDEQMKNLQIRAIASLRQIGDMRPLFAMFIADALLDGQEPMNWKREDVLEYAVVKREEELLKDEVRDIKGDFYQSIYDMTKGIVILTIIKDGIEFSEVNCIKKEMEEELNLSGIGLKGFLKELQLLESDGTIRKYMPDILAEYYVLRTLVLNPDQDILKWIINQLINSFEGVVEFRQKVRQDFRYLYGKIEDKLDDFYDVFFEQCGSDMTFDVFMNLIVGLDFQDSNVIVFHRVIRSLIQKEYDKEKMALMLYTVLCDDLFLRFNKNTPDLREKWECLQELGYITELNSNNIEIVRWYSNGLCNMMNVVQDLNEKRECFQKLNHLAEVHSMDEQVGVAYSKGLFNMLHYSLDQNEKRNCLQKLKHLAETYATNPSFLSVYCEGLYDELFRSVGIEEKKKWLHELRYLAELNTKNSEIVCWYGNGLLNMTCFASDPKEKESYFQEIKRFSELNNGNEAVMLIYAKGLANMIVSAPAPEKKIEYLQELKLLTELNVKNIDIIIEYCRGLSSMTHNNSNHQEANRCLHELKRLANMYDENTEIALKYSGALVNMTCYAPTLEKKYGYLEELNYLVNSNPDNAEIVLDYSKGLVNMMQEQDYFDDCVTELERLFRNQDYFDYVKEKEPSIITSTRAALYAYEQSNRIRSNTVQNAIIKEVFYSKNGE